MSYVFNATNERLTGTFTTSIGPPLSIGIFIKVPDYQLASRTFMALSSAVANDDSVYFMMTSAIDNQWLWFNQETTTNTRSVSRTVANDGVWFGLVGRCLGSNSRFVDDITGASAEGTNTAAISSNLNLIRLGENAAGGQDLGTSVVDNKLAEIAIWDIGLSSQNISDYLNGISASTIASANLRGYWPLSTDNATQSNQGLDADGDLTVTGATFDADHPTITTGTAPSLYVVRSSIRLN